MVTCVTHEVSISEPSQIMTVAFHPISCLSVCYTIVLCIQQVMDVLFSYFQVREIQSGGELSTLVSGKGDVRPSGNCAVVDTADE